MDRTDKVIEIVKQELLRGVRKHRPMNSSHEGYAVILEELDELWEEVKKREPSETRIQQEATQVAAMAIRFLLDVTEIEEVAISYCKSCAKDVEPMIDDDESVCPNCRLVL